jgi:hypothetical protein
MVGTMALPNMCDKVNAFNNLNVCAALINVCQKTVSRHNETLRQLVVALIREVV